MSNNLNEQLLTLPQFQEHQFTSSIPIYELGVERALIAFWRRHELLPFIQKGKWAQVSLVEAIWIQLLNSLRNLGASVEMLKKVTTYFIKRAYEDELPKRNLEELKEALDKKRIAGTISFSEKIQLQNVEEILKDKELLYQLKWDVNYFSNLLNETVLGGEEGKVLIFEDGTICECLPGKMRSSKGEGEGLDFSAPHISVSLSYFLKQFVKGEQLSNFLTMARYFSEDEERVLRELKNKNVESILIELKGGKIKNVKTTRSGQLSPDQAQKVKEILGLRNYESVELHTRDEKTIVFKRTKKR